VDLDLRPAEHLCRLQVPLTSDQPTILADHDRVQQAELVDAARERTNVAHILATALAYLDGLQRQHLAHSSTLWAARMRSFSAR
jgi:hypothetical protein